MDLTPREELDRRIAALQERMGTLSWDAVLIMLRADLFYFAGTAQNGVLVIPAEGDPILLIQKSVTRARQESPLDHIHPMRSISRFGETLSGIREMRFGTVGLEMDVVPAAVYLRLARQYPDTTWVDASVPVRELRMVKSSHEILRMRNAAAQLREMFDRVPEFLGVGIRELDVSVRLEAMLRKLGHQGTIRMHKWNSDSHYGPVSSGPTALYPHAFDGPVGTQGLYAAVPQGAGIRKIRPNEPVMIDFVSGYGGYHIDETRIYSLGPVAPELLEAHEFALTILRRIEDRLTPGALCSDIYEEIATDVNDHPLAPYFMGHGDNRVRFLGHGVGLELDELPVIAPRFEIALQPGMTIAVEPKVFLPDLGGVGVENTYLITEGGFEKLTTNPEEITIC
ncbi:MAG: aminopeptidase P family protein [Candidatus Eisenbacteria sp.]|nr:aminopeptidase P family protein [Candidatus Eisenbacteria bacterium]